MILFLVLAAVLQGSYSILPPGEFHHDEVQVEEGAEWFSLSYDGEEWQLVPCEIQIEQVHDPLLDAEGEATGWRVGDETSKALVYISAEDGVLEPGQVSSELVKAYHLIPGDFFPLGGDREAILVEAAGVFYNLNGDNQKLSDAYEMETGEEISLIWLGDLDGDGRNDIIINDRSHYAIYMNYRLFLSSEAEEGQLLKEVASFMSVSC